MARAIYDAWVSPRFAWVRPEQDVIIVEDLCMPGTMSVTNDAEQVVLEVVERFGNKRILYYDTEGNLDELCHDDGLFTGFAPGPRR